MSAADDWGLWVNETGIFASRIAMDRWLDFLSRDKGNRAVVLWAAPCGGEWHVMCGSRDDARDALETFLGVGFHKNHVKVARRSACQAKVASRLPQGVLAAAP